MAWSFTIKSVQPVVSDTVGAGGTTGGGARWAGLEVVVDRQGAESGGYVLRLAYVSYAGLEAEWAAGVATTVLSAAVSAALAAGAYTTSSNLTTAQKALLGTSISIAE